ncbi:esterase/lipase family protein [Nocardioides sp. GCM10027113]|uniref:esterase/lipase family protein n=1 Tax=unclassified Nocardioides TaxID=2615069 RepID=UPI0036194BF3
MRSTTLAAFLRPDGFEPPLVSAVVREASVVREVGRYALRSVGERRSRRDTPYAARTAPRSGDPVVLVPGFLAGDGSLRWMSASLRRQGLRTYRSNIHANIGCTVDAAALLEARLESIASRRGSRVQVVGHSLGGMLARGVAARRPDLVSGIVTLGSPMLAPAAHHISLAASVEMLVRLSRVGVPGLMSDDCVGGDCARRSFDDSRLPIPADVAFTAIYSRRDGIVDWRACIDPQARAVEVTTSHVGMAVDPDVIDRVVAALTAGRSALEVDRGEIA